MARGGVDDDYVWDRVCGQGAWRICHTGAAGDAVGAECGVATGVLSGGHDDGWEHAVEVS